MAPALQGMLLILGCKAGVQDVYLADETADHVSER